MNSNLFKLGCNIWVHIAMYILQIPLFIYLLCKDLFLQKKKITEYCACIYMDFFRLQNLLNLHIYKCHIYLTQCSFCMGSFYIFLIYMYLYYLYSHSDLNIYHDEIFFFNLFSHPSHMCIQYIWNSTTFVIHVIWALFVNYLFLYMI